MLLKTFEAIRRYDPDRVSEWEAWAERRLKQPVEVELGRVLEVIGGSSESSSQSPTSPPPTPDDAPAMDVVPEADISQRSDDAHLGTGGEPAEDGSDRSQPESEHDGADDGVISSVARGQAGVGNRESQIATPSRRHVVSSAYERGERYLENFIASHDASSCTFYLRDPGSEEYRLLYMPGVVITEPMHGLVLPTATRNRISSGRPIEYMSHAPGDWRLEDGPLNTPGELVGQAPIFGGFVRREGVKSCARLTHWDSDVVQATLFVNFGEDRDFQASPALKAEIESLMDAMIGMVPELRGNC